jgi:hypothetical protein
MHVRASEIQGEVASIGNAEKFAAMGSAGHRLVSLEILQRFAQLRCLQRFVSLSMNQYRWVFAAISIAEVLLQCFPAIPQRSQSLPKLNFQRSSALSQRSQSLPKPNFQRSSALSLTTRTRFMYVGVAQILGDLQGCMLHGRKSEHLLHVLS